MAVLIYTLPFIAITCVAKLKPKNVEPIVLLQPLVIPFIRCERVSVDCVTDLLACDGYDSTMVVADELRKENPLYCNPHIRYHHHTRSIKQYVATGDDMQLLSHMYIRSVHSVFGRPYGSAVVPNRA